MKRDIIFYKTESGKCPIQDFFDLQPLKVLKKISWVLNIVRQEDIIPQLYFKKLKSTDEIYECRIQVASNIYRLLCFFDKGSLVILTHGFVKKTQKTPKKEIETAQRYKQDYFRRKK